MQGNNTFKLEKIASAGDPSGAERSLTLRPVLLPKPKKKNCSAFEAKIPPTCFSKQSPFRQDGHSYCVLSVVVASFFVSVSSDTFYGDALAGRQRDRRVFRTFGWLFSPEVLQNKEI
ncbi:UNVERIFIED_CONTAM: hypothetical protein K2H54_072011 [Gekko kuhli]